MKICIYFIDGYIGNVFGTKTQQTYWHRNMAKIKAEIYWYSYWPKIWEFKNNTNNEHDPESNLRPLKLPFIYSTSIRS